MRVVARAGLFSSYRKGGPRGCPPAGPVVVLQIVWKLPSNDKEYVSTEAWRLARLDACPAHPKGGCGYHKNGHYIRKTDWDDAKIPRWYCRMASTTFSLLAQCFASHMMGSLQEVEEAALVAETSPSLAAAVRELRPDDLDGSASSLYRWIKHRHDAVLAVLTLAITLMPDLLMGCDPTVSALRARLGTTTLLFDLRAHVGTHLRHIPRPVGPGYAPRGPPKSDIGSGIYEPTEKGSGFRAG